MKNQNKRNNGITLVALVITIVLLLILAGITLATLGGENGLIVQSKETIGKYSINQEKEKLELKIIDLRVELERRGESLTKEKLPQINNDEIDVVDTEEFPVEVICGKYKFNVDENYKVTYLGEADGTIVRYTIEPEGYTNENEVKILIKANNPNGIKTIEYPSGDKIEVTEEDKTKVEINYTVTANGTYIFRIIDNAGKETIKDIVIEQFDRLEPENFEIIAENTETGLIITANTKDAEADGISIKSGINRYEYFLKKEGETEYIKYETSKIDNLEYGIYQVFVIAYDNAGNSIKSEEEQLVFRGNSYMWEKWSVDINKYFRSYVVSKEQVTSFPGSRRTSYTFDSSTGIYTLTGDTMGTNALSTTGYLVSKALGNTLAYDKGPYLLKYSNGYETRYR